LRSLDPGGGSYDAQPGSIIPRWFPGSYWVPINQTGRPKLRMPHSSLPCDASIWKIRGRPTLTRVLYLNSYPARPAITSPFRSVCSGSPTFAQDWRRGIECLVDNFIYDHHTRCALLEKCVEGSHYRSRVSAAFLRWDFHRKRHIDPNPIVHVGSDVRDVVPGARSTATTSCQSP
jgi:hypothetical protein